MHRRVSVERHPCPGVDDNGVMPSALITGASVGLGRGFAEALAAGGHDVVLVARNVARLEQAAAELVERFGIAAEVLPADLSSSTARERVVSRLIAEPVDVLVNNAGFGIGAAFVGGSYEAEQALLDVMVTAPMQFCHAVLPGMVDRGNGAVINVSSMAGWATEGTYSAAKAWVTTFTEGLQPELAGTGVTATAVCPGAVRTEIWERSGVEMHLPGFMWLAVEDVVAKALSDARRGRVISVASPQYQALSTLTQYAPRPLVRFATAHRDSFTRFLP